MAKKNAMWGWIIGGAAVGGALFWVMRGKTGSGEAAAPAQLQLDLPPLPEGCAPTGHLAYAVGDTLNTVAGGLDDARAAALARMESTDATGYVLLAALAQDNVACGYQVLDWGGDDAAVQNTVLSLSQRYSIYGG